MTVRNVTIALKVAQALDEKIERLLTQAAA
jgi:hypothetical protein